MKEHIVSLVVLIAVAVDALPSSYVSTSNLIVEDLRLLERGKMALGYLHETPGNIRWLNQTIRHVFVDGFLGDADFKRGE